VDARYSQDNTDVGQARWGKLFLAVKYVLQALWCRVAHGVKVLYYVPAFPARTPVLRDWLVLGVCRAVFPKTVFHWHATGLADWLETRAPGWMRRLSHRVYAGPDLSIILRAANRRDAEFVASRRTAVVPNGIPDPCPDFAATVLPRRLARVVARQRLASGKELTDAERAAAGGDPEDFRLLFISLCYSGKGLFDAVEAVALANARLKGGPLRVCLTVAGSFWNEAEKARFEQRIRQPDLIADGRALVEYRGFVSGAEKARLFHDSDCLCFPTCMPESFGLTLVEGMAWGLPIIVTDWQGLPELLPTGSPGVVPPKSPEQIAAVAVSFLGRDYDPGLREYFLAHYTEQTFVESLKRELLSLETGGRVQP
jgi:glycosyltransferase involved in cell wall biosynthesis